MEQSHVCYGGHQAERKSQRLDPDATFKGTPTSGLHSPITSSHINHLLNLILPSKASVIST